LLGASDAQLATYWSERKVLHFELLQIYPVYVLKVILTDLEVRKRSKGVSICTFVLDVHFLFSLLCFVLYRLKYNVVVFRFKFVPTFCHTQQ
jgi:hypothetical protein